MSYFSYIREYLDKSPSLQCVPVKDKAPYMESWQSIQVTDDIIESWEDNDNGRANGFGFRAGQYNIGYADIDTDDVEFQFRFDEIMDLSPICCKKGLKGKTIFFRFTGIPQKSKYNIYVRKGDKKPIFEFNFTSGQTVLPPSIHPQTGLPYKWISQSLLDIDIEDLPIIDESKIQYLEQIIQAPSLAEGLKNVPTSVTGDGSGKWKTITSEASRLLHLGIDESSIAKTLVGYDRFHFPGNQFFLSTKIGKDLISKTNDIENAVMWVSTYKQNIMRQDPELRKTLSSIAKISTQVESHGEWLPPRQLENKQKIMEFPEHLFPDAFKSYCFDLSRQSALPPEAYLTAIFCSFSAVCQAKVTIEAMSNFKVHPSICTMIVAPSGSRKDAIFDAAMEPLRKLINAQLDKVDQNFIEKEKDTITKLEDLSRRKKKAISENDQVSVDELNRIVIETQGELLVIKKQRPNFIFESGTQEKLYEVMAQNQHIGVFINASEYVHLMGSINKKGNESFRGFLLKLFNGSTTESFIHQTKTGTNVNIRKVIGCALVGAQTDVLAHDIRDMEAGRQSDGLLQRFFLITINPEIREMEDSDIPINSSRIDNLYALMYGHNAHIYATWDSAETKKCYTQYDLELRRRTQFEKSAIRSFRNKYSGKSVQLAWMYEIANSPPGHIPSKISKKSFILAVEYLEWLAKNLDLIWSNVNYNTAHRAAETVIDAIRLNGIREDHFQNDVLRVTRLSHGDFALAVALLEEYGYVRRTGGKYEINTLI